MPGAPDSSLLDLNQPVGGEFGITAELPTLELIHSFREGEFALRYGYYRHVDHPKLEALQEALALAPDDVELKYQMAVAYMELSI